jgi:hypothetical protein
MTSAAGNEPLKRMTPEEREAVKDRLAKLEAANGGVLTPDSVVADAKRKDSPLHRFFTWDIKAAAAAYWVQQARTLITSVRIERRTDTTVISSVYYVRDPNAPSEKQGYVSVKTLQTDEEMARVALIQEFARVGDLLRRARELAAVLEQEDRVDALVRQVFQFRNDLLSGGAASPPQ